MILRKKKKTHMDLFILKKLPDLKWLKKKKEYFLKKNLKTESKKNIILGLRLKEVVLIMNRNSKINHWKCLDLKRISKNKINLVSKLKSEISKIN
jgi:hypothetical protein